MSTKKNQEILESITKRNYLELNEKAIVDSMLKQEVAGQRVFYVYLKQNGLEINPENMDKNQSDGIIGNRIIECKLNENEGGGLKKAYEELYFTIPNRLKQKGDRLPYYRIYVELETFLVEVYDCHCNLVDTFDWFKEPTKFIEYFNDKKNTYEYDLEDEEVDLVEVIQNIYKVSNIQDKMGAYQKLEEGIDGWFKPLKIENVNINRLILNNDKMNEKYVQKEQGRFFTPSKYVKISTQYVNNRIKQSQEQGYDDYVIVDRCRGVGNLESQFDEEVYSHLILGTINEAERFTANIRFGGKATVVVQDALSKEGVKYYQDKIEEYKSKHNVKNLAVIFLENPPYTQLNSNKEGGTNHKSKEKKEKNWVHTQMEKGGEDLDEQFVFSVYKYFNTFSYIHYGPIKIWKSRHLISKEVKERYLCNRKYFNASESRISLFHWGKEDKDYNEVSFDSDFEGKFVVKKVFNTISKLYEDEGEEKGICIIESRNYSFSSPRLTGSLNNNGKYGKKWVSEENLLNVLPLFRTRRDEISEKGGITKEDKDYRIIDTTYKTSDGGTKYQKDSIFLQDCLLWSLCIHYNQCSTDSKFYEVSEKLLIKSNIQENIQEDKDLSTLERYSKINNFNIDLSKIILKGKIYKLYKHLSNETGLNGLYNIERYNKEEHGKLWKHHTLNPKVKELKSLLQKFQINYIRPKLLEYELLK